MGLRLPTVPYKNFEKLNVRLWHAGIGILAVWGWCEPLNHSNISKNGVTKFEGGHTCSTSRLAMDVNWNMHTFNTCYRSCGTNNNKKSDIDYVDTLGIGTGGVWMSTTGEYSNIIWRME